MNRLIRSNRLIHAEVKMTGTVKVRDLMIGRAMRGWASAWLTRFLDRGLIYRNGNSPIVYLQVSYCYIIAWSLYKLIYDYGTDFATVSLMLPLQLLPLVLVWLWLQWLQNTILFLIISINYQHIQQSLHVTYPEF